MFVIFGFRTRASRIGQGVFFCPHCGVDRQYQLRQMRRWFTLFFIPVFPAGPAQGKHVKCETCGKLFQPTVLTTPTSAALADALRYAMRVAVIALLRAGDAQSPTAQEAAVGEMVAAGGSGYGRDALVEDLRALDVSNLAAAIGPLAKGLNQQGKETFVTRLARIAASTGPITEGQTHVIETVGATLGLSVAHLAGIVTLATRTDQER